MNLTWDALGSGDWPPADAASGTRGTLTVEDPNGWSGKDREVTLPPGGPY